jgi:hypothetical protein
MAAQDIEPTILRATGGVHPLDVTFIDDEDLATPWKRESTASKKLTGPMPQSLTVTLANLIYFEKAQLPQALANRLIRLAAFQNPEFYKAQAMRLSVWDKPRIIGCAENFPQHIALPRGCFDAARELLADNGIRLDLRDERHAGTPVAVGFSGTLRPDQEVAVAAMLRHDDGVLPNTPVACTGNTPARPTFASSTSWTRGIRPCCGCGTSANGVIGRWGIASIRGRRLSPILKGDVGWAGGRNGWVDNLCH